MQNAHDYECPLAREAAEKANRSEAPDGNPNGDSPVKVEQSRGSFEAKGDSAKTLSLFNGGKTAIGSHPLPNGTPVPAGDQ